MLGIRSTHRYSPIAFLASAWGGDDIIGNGKAKKDSEYPALIPHRSVRNSQQPEHGAASSRKVSTRNQSVRRDQTVRVGDHGRLSSSQNPIFPFFTFAT